MNTVEDSAAGRPAQVCQACRIRHKKCDFDGEACKQCQSIGLHCVRQPTFRFRYDPKQAALASASPTSQSLWSQPQMAVDFYDETPGLLQSYSVGALERHTYADQSPTGLFALPSTPKNTADVEGNASSAVYLSPPSDKTSPENTGRSPGQWSAAQPFTEAEATLVRNFAEHMALWTDVTDSARSFEFEVPRRALTEPLLRHAICAFSARHYHRGDGNGGGQTEALDHQNKCLELLIPAMSGGQATSESTLTAVALLRQNEEMDEHDNRFHLEGVSRILNMAPDFAAAGGLGEAAAWLSLREDIYVSLTTQSPINIRVQSFYDSASLRSGDDIAWANGMVLALAVLLDRAFREPASHDDLSASEAEVAEWDRSKPGSFVPIYFKPRSIKEGRQLPEVWMLAPHHAVGMQYFHIAQIVLQVLKDRMSSRPYEHLAESRARERRIRSHLLMVVGIAVSNPRAENTWFTARHCLSVWSACLRKRGDQKAALDFLRDMEQRTGWRTAVLAASMQRQWDEDSDEG